MKAKETVERAQQGQTAFPPPEVTASQRRPELNPEGAFKALMASKGHEFVQTPDSYRCRFCSKRWTYQEVANRVEKVFQCDPNEKAARPLAARAQDRAQRVADAAEIIIHKLKRYQSPDAPKDLNDTVEITLRMTLETIEKQLLTLNCPPPPEKR